MRVQTFVVVGIVLFFACCAQGSFEHPDPFLLGKIDKASSSLNTPTITSLSTRLGPPSQYIYVGGSAFTKEGKVQLLPVGNGKAVSVPFVFYSSGSLGVTVPNDAPPFFKVQFSNGAGSTVSTEVFSVGVPILPPVIRSFSSNGGNVGCYLYVGGDNFYVGKTAVQIGGIPLYQPVIYNTNSLGITVPVLLNCTGPVIVTVTTPNGRTASEKAFTVGCGPATKNFC